MNILFLYIQRLIQHWRVAHLYSMSVQETDAPNLVEIYPNPVSDIINVKTKEDVQCVRVYETNGKLIKSFN